MTETALIVIDVQNGVVEEAWDADRIVENIATVIEKARDAQVPVIFIQHESPEAFGMAPGSHGWQFDPRIQPRADEVIVPKTTPDSFYKTNLLDVLQERGIKHLVITGGVTNFCVDTTVRRAFSLEFSQTVIADGHLSGGTPSLTGEQIVTLHNETFPNLFWREAADGWQPGIVLATASEVSFA